MKVEGNRKLVRTRQIARTKTRKCNKAETMPKQGNVQGSKINKIIKPCSTRLETRTTEIKTFKIMVTVNHIDIEIQHIYIYMYIFVVYIHAAPSTQFVAPST